MRVKAICASMGMLALLAYPLLRHSQQAALSEWVFNDSFGIPVWIALNAVPEGQLVASRKIFLFIEARYFTEHDIASVFAGLAAKSEEPESLSITAFSDKQMLNRAVSDYLSPGIIEREFVRPVERTYFWADYSRRQGAEIYRYKPDPNKEEYVTGQVKKPTVLYTGEPTRDLLIASREGDATKVTSLLAEGAGINVQDPKTRETPLLLAARSGNSTLAVMLLRNGANANARDLDGWAPILAAATHGDISLMRELVKSGADVNVRDDIVGDSALLLSAYRDRFDIVQFLVGNGADVNAKDRRGQTALLSAVGNSNAHMVRELLKAGADVNGRNNTGETALMIATRDNRTSIIEILTRAGAR